MAGNQSDERRAAERAFEDSKRSLGEKHPSTLALKSDYEAKKAIEDGATGGNPNPFI